MLQQLYVFFAYAANPDVAPAPLQCWPHNIDGSFCTTFAPYERTCHVVEMPSDVCEQCDNLSNGSCNKN